MTNYTNRLKEEVCNLICEQNASTIYTAEQFNVPLKTVEKWVTAYNKDKNCFHSKQDVYFTKQLKPADKKRYASLSREQLRHELMKRDVELARLKKGYTVRRSGTKQEYGSF